MQLTMPRLAVPRGVSIVVVLLLLLIAAIAATILIAGSQRRLPPPLGPAAAGLMAFDTGGDIFVANPDGSNRRALSATDANEFGPAWSRDGSRLAFWSIPPKGHPEVVIVDSDGSHRVAIGRDLDLFPDTRKWAPVWSPDGRMLLIATIVGDLYRVNADGTDVHRLGNNQVGHFYPSWSPDGSRIAFLDGSWQGGFVAVMDIDGRVETRISHVPSGGPSWSPDGRRLAYWTPIDYGDIAVATIDGSTWTESLVVAGPTDDVAPVWSNDGTRLAFLRMNGNIGTLFVTPADGGSLRAIADESEKLVFARPCWSPDDRFVTALSAKGAYVLAPVEGAGRPIQIAMPDMASIDSCAWQRLAP